MGGPDLCGVIRLSAAMRLGVLLISLATLAAASADEPVLLAPQPRKHLACDPRLIERVENARLVLGKPEKAAENPLFQADKAWENSLNNLYPNVLWDADAKLFKLWYKCVLADASAIAGMDGPSTVHEVGWYLLYATSKDGLRWEKPELGLHRFQGTDATNIVARDCPNVGVFKDARDPDPERRYKMVSDVGLGKPRVRFSADGIHWGAAREVSGFGPKNGDTHNNAFWDEELGRYLWFTKLYLGERTMARFESADFLNWTNTGMVLRSTVEEGRSSQTYCMTPFRYGSGWLAYVMIYHPGKDRSVDCELAWSPDSLNWRRLLPGTAFLPRGPKGSYDSECLYAMAGPPVMQDGRLLIYYGGDDYPHTGWKRHCLPCVARLPVDRFAGYAAESEPGPGRLLSRPLVLTEEPIRMSTDVAEGGFLRVTALNDEDAPVAEADVPVGSASEAELNWKGEGLAAKAGDRLRFRVELSRATLWALSGADLVETSLPSSPGVLRSAEWTPRPVSRQAVSFDEGVEGWKGVDAIQHHRAGGAPGGYVSVSRAGRALPIAFSPVPPGDSPLAGDWPERFGGDGAAVSCQVRASQPGGKVQIEIFAKDVAQWSRETEAKFGPDWSEATVSLRYGWTDEEATKAGWKRAANGFSWEETIRDVGKVVVVPAAAGPQSAFDLDEVTVEGVVFPAAP